MRINRDKQRRSKREMRSKAILTAITPVILSVAMSTSGFGGASAVDAQSGRAGAWVTPNPVIQVILRPSNSLNGVTPAAGTVCNAQVNNPHWSQSGSTVLFKTTVICTGPAAVNIQGTLGAGPLVGPPNPVAFSNQTQTAVPGYQLTYYTPQLGSPSVACHSGTYYQGWVTMTATNGQGTVSGSGFSNRVTAC